MGKNDESVKTLIALSAFILVFATLSPAATEFKTLDTAQLHSMVVDNAYEIEAGRNVKFMIIDARSQEEYDQLHVFSAISMPENSFDTSHKYLPTDKKVLLVVYCNSIESGESRRWAEKAVSAGYTNITIYMDSFTAWREQHFPVLPFSNIRR